MDGRRLSRGLALLAFAACSACGGAGRPVEASRDPEPAPRGGAPVSPARPMGLRRIADGALFTTPHGAYLVACDPSSVARVTRGQTAPLPALDQALRAEGVGCVTAIVEPSAGRMLLATGSEGEERVWRAWTDGSLLRAAAPADARPARLAVPPDYGGAKWEQAALGEIVVEPASRYPRAASPVRRLRGQLLLPGGGLVLVGHLDDGALATEVWRAPGEPARAEALPGAPPWTNWDPFLAPRAARLASAGPGHACVVPTAIVETLMVRYLACLEGGRFQEVDTAALDGTIVAIDGAEGWTWVATSAGGVFRRAQQGSWERVGALEPSGDAPILRARSASEVYVSSPPQNWVALEIAAPR